MAQISDIQKAMLMLIDTFHKYSGVEGDKCTLTKGELKSLLNAELGDLTGANDTSTVDKLFASLDVNTDSVIDFKEYVNLVAVLTMCCNDFFQQHS